MLDVRTKTFHIMNKVDVSYELCRSDDGNIKRDFKADIDVISDCACVPMKVASG